MTRTVADAALMLQVLAGPDPTDPSTVALSVPDFRAALDGRVRGLRVGLPREVFFAHLDPDVDAGVRAAARALEGLGVAAEEVSVPGMDDAAAATFAIIAAESMAYHGPLLRQHGASYGPDVRTRLLAGQFILATQYVNAQRVRQVIRAGVDTVLARVDALLLPTTPSPAPRIEERETTVDGITQDVRAWLTRCTRPFNLTGHPALSLPCGLTRTGLPIGLQLVGRMFDEVTLIRLGAAYEAVSPLRGQRPPEP
jgi:Asp-tRNA(Asn)/Glu-tRNA(Gln) amidotransferase A subunit family amidase